jgi:hypothetical protein
MRARLPSASVRLGVARRLHRTLLTVGMPAADDVPAFRWAPLFSGRLFPSAPITDSPAKAPSRPLQRSGERFRDGFGPAADDVYS